MAKKLFTCIVCPLGCQITVEDADGDLEITGNTCAKGAAFAKDEYTNPKRMLTTTVKVDGGTICRLPVISSAEISRTRLIDCLNKLYQITVRAPVRLGDIVCVDICGTGVDILAARDIPSR